MHLVGSAMHWTDDAHLEASVSVACRVGARHHVGAAMHWTVGARWDARASAACSACASPPVGSAMHWTKVSTGVSSMSCVTPSRLLGVHRHLRERHGCRPLRNETFVLYRDDVDVGKRVVRVSAVVVKEWPHSVRSVIGWGVRPNLRGHAADDLWIT